MDAGVGAVVLIDELHELDRPSMAALAGAAHVAGQRSVPFVVVGAGLPNLVGRLAEAKSYAERLFDFRRLGPLDRAVAVDALTEPAAAAGLSWSAEALDLVTDAAGGFPYFLQEFGAACWNVADGPVVTASDARAGVQPGAAHARPRVLPVAVGPSDRDRARVPARHGGRRRREPHRGRRAADGPHDEQHRARSGPV